MLKNPETISISYRNTVGMKGISLYFLAVILFAISCAPQQPPKIKSINILPPPSIQGGESHLHLCEKGELYLSWIEYQDEQTDVLYFATFQDQQWTPKKEITRGDNWFVNWADFPSLVSYNGSQTLAAHWLEKSDKGTYDYDIKITQSQDAGNTWSDPITIHKDSIAAEHGFVSMASNGDHLMVSWLDGRNTKPSPGNKHDHSHGQGAMTLRAAMLDPGGHVTHSVELDASVCDCCQTSLAKTENGFTLAYRDRKSVV